MTTTFIDVGAHTGQTLVKAIEEFPDCGRYIGIEPIPELVRDAIDRLLGKVPDTGKEEKSKQPELPLLYSGADNILMCCCAIDVLPAGVSRKEVEIYEDLTWTRLGSSLMSDKKTAKKRTRTITCFDANYFLNFLAPEGDIILKVDIEGKEYDVLDSLLDSGFLQKRVKKLFVEWHWHKTDSISEEHHKSLVARLNEAGFPLTGSSRADEFYCGL